MMPGFFYYYLVLLFVLILIIPNCSGGGGGDYDFEVFNDDNIEINSNPETNRRHHQHNYHDDDKDDENKAFSAIPHEFPWMASIEVFFNGRTTSKLCGASLISDQWLLTAAHCVSSGGRTAAIIIASLGKHNIGINMEPREVRKHITTTLVNPQYTTDTHGTPLNYDFALLKMSTPIVITPQTRPIALPDRLCQSRYFETTSLIDNCRMVTTASWRPLDLDYKQNTLKKINLLLQPFADCASTMHGNYFSTAKLCAEDEDGGLQSCLIGHSGDPLMCQVGASWYLIGVLSHKNSHSCSSVLSQGTPRIYSRTCQVVSWIKAHAIGASPDWDKVTVKQECGAVPTVENGTVTNGTFEIGAARQVVCDPGYELSFGGSSIVCQSSGDWSKPGSCLPSQDINPLVIPETPPQCVIPYVKNGFFMVDGITVAPYNSASFRTIVVLHCSIGYNMTEASSSQSICTSSGDWQPKIGYCINSLATTTTPLPITPPTPPPTTPRQFPGHVKIEVTRLPSAAAAASNDPPPHFTIDYYEFWKKRFTRVVFTGPSDVQAIINIPNSDNVAETLSVIAVCYHGEIIELSRTNFTAVLWESSVSLPIDLPNYTTAAVTKNNSAAILSVSHAVYDEVLDEIYLTLSSHPSSLYRVSRAELQADWNGNGVQLRYLALAGSDARLFSSLTIDSTSRLLYACDDITYDGDISVWYVPLRPSSSLAKLVAVIKSAFRPSFVSFHYATTNQLYHIYRSGVFSGSSDNDDIDLSVMLLAVSSAHTHSVDLFAIDFSSFAKSINENTLSPHLNRPVVYNNSLSIKQGVRHIATVARWNRTSPLQAGSVYSPREVHFDAVGRLFVADDLNYRLQGFAMTGENHRLMSPIWVSGSTGWELWSFSIVMQNATSGHVSALVSKYNEILAFE